MSLNYFERDNYLSSFFGGGTFFENVKIESVTTKTTRCLFNDHVALRIFRYAASSLYALSRFHKNNRSYGTFGCLLFNPTRNVTKIIRIDREDANRKLHGETIGQKCAQGHWLYHEISVFLLHTRADLSLKYVRKSVSYSIFKIKTRQLEGTLVFCRKNVYIIRRVYYLMQYTRSVL